MSTTASPITPPRGIAVLLAAVAAIGPFAVDTYLPSFHDIEQSLGASQLEVQQTLTAYLLPFAFMSLWHGALSDALGRRSVILTSLGLFALAALGCVFATRIEHLWILRALQGVSAGAGVVISRAIVRDFFEGPAAQRLMSHITMMFAIAPAIAPVIGGRLQTWFGWRSVFLFLTIAILFLAAACWRWLPETLPREKRQSLRPSYLGRAYWRTMTSPAFLAACGGMAFNFAGFFLYLMSSPEFLLRHLGVSETGFLWLFGPAMTGMLGGSWLSGRLAGKISPTRTIRYGFMIMVFAVSLNLFICSLLPPGLPWSVLPIPLYTLGMSLTMPSLTLLALDPFPTQRGLAASCQMFLQSTFNSVIAGVIAPALWGSTLSLALGMAGFLSLGAICSYAHSRLMQPGRKS